MGIGLVLLSSAEGLHNTQVGDYGREAVDHGAINLSQGYPDFAAPAELKNKAGRS